MSKLLINEPPLQVLPTLAKAIGLNEAIVLQQLHYVSLRSRDDGWVQQALSEWAREEFKFWSYDTFQRTVRKLKDAGLIEIETVGVAGGQGGTRREARIRVNHTALDALELRIVRSPQSAGTSRRQSAVTSGPQSAVTSGGNLHGPRTDLKEEREERKKKTSSSSRDDRPEVVRLAALLAELMLANDPKAKVNPTTKGWLDPIRLLLDRDDRTEDQVERVIRFTQADTFERSNVLCPAKLRARFPQLWLKTERTGGPSPRPAAGGIRGAAIVEPCPNGTTDAAAIAAWEAGAARLRDRVSAEHYAVWLEELHAHRLDDKGLVLACPLGVHGWVKERFGTVIATSAQMPVRFVACSGAKH